MRTHYFYDAALLGNMVGTMFVGIILGKPSQDFTRPLGMLRGLKDLLHPLNEIVYPTKE
jgi:hypothetical protein